MSQVSRKLVLPTKALLLIMISTMILGAGMTTAVQAQEITPGKLPKVSTDFTQGANNDSPYPKGTPHWIGSILQHSNSIFYEGMSVPQRVIFSEIPATAGDNHVLRLSVEATKAQLHAYDFLTSWENALEAADAVAPGKDLLVNLFTNQCGPEHWKATEAICSAIHGYGYLSAADLTVLDMGTTTNGDNVQEKAANYDAYFADPRVVKVWGNQPVSGASITFDGYGGTANNQYAEYSLYWTSASDTIIIELAGHLGVGVDYIGSGVGYGEGKGSSAISGGPYHFKLSNLDGVSLGSQDNQIMGASILVPLRCETADPDPVCEGEPVTLSVAVTGGTPDYTYCWEKFPYTDPPTCLSTSDTYVIPSATPADAGEYRVIVNDEDENGPVYCYATVTVYEAPTCNLPQPGPICEGDDLTLTVTPGGTGPFTYCWQRPPSIDCIGTGQSYDITSATVADAGTYRVVVTGVCGDTYCEADVVVCAPSCRLGCPEPLPICGSSGNTLSAAEVNAAGPVTYAWTLTGDGWYIESGEATEEITYHAGSVASVGTFTLTITDSCGCESFCTVDCECQSGTYCTYTMGGWGSTCPESHAGNRMSTQPGCIRDNYFGNVFDADGVWIGDPDGIDTDNFYAAQWTNAEAVREFLPAGGPPAALTGDITNWVDEPRTSVLAGQILVLHLNVEYSCEGVFDSVGLWPTAVGCYSTFEIPDVCANDKFDGMNVGQFLALADSAVGGLDVLPVGVDLSDVNFTATCLNEYFIDCTPPAPAPIGAEIEPPTEPMLRPAENPEVQLPTAFEVTGAYPNPVNATTTIRFALPVEGKVTVDIFDIRGRSVVRLLNDQKPAGYYDLLWNGRDSQGEAVSEGVYFCRVKFSDNPDVMKKMIKLN